MYIRLVGVVTTNDSILLIQKKETDHFKYIFPGGHWDFPEAFKTGAEREVYEESGASVKATKIIKVHFNLKPLRIEIFYQCKLVSLPFGKLKPTHFDGENKGNHFKPMFINKNELSDIYIKYPSQRRVVEMFRMTPN